MTYHRYIELGPTTVWFAKQKNGCIVQFYINDAMSDDDVKVQSTIYYDIKEYPIVKAADIIKGMQLPNFEKEFIGYECSTDTFENIKQLGSYKEVYMTATGINRSF